MSEIKIDWTPSKKQFTAYKILEDKETTELLYGGGAGGGKSYLCCAWLIIKCLQYPGSRWLMGRATLKTLKQTTLLSFFDICKEWGIKKGEAYNYNIIDGVITFYNGSEIYLKDLKLYPQDPEFDSLGSTEYTGAFIDEASEVSAKAKEIVMTRIRYKLDEFGIIPKLLIASNPCKNFLYSEFYKPNRDGSIEPYRRFLTALVYDNPFISKYYIQNLERSKKVTRERLLKGNWEYDNDPSKLFVYDSIIDMFTNGAKRGIKYCIVDQSGRGRDKAVVTLWDGLFVYKILMFDIGISNTQLDEILLREKIPRSRCLVDEDGVGFGLVRDLKGVKGFVNNASPIKEKKELRDQKKVETNYASLKAQCWDTLSSYVNIGKIGIYREIKTEYKDLLTEDLDHMKQINVGKDQPFRVSTKENLREDLKRSTDIGDTFMMRMFFELRTPYKPYVSV